MKKALVILMFLAGCSGKENPSGDQADDTSASTQERQLSPKDVIETSIDGVKTKIVYCRPSARGRDMVGGKDPYGEVWRTGANEATTIEFEDNVKIEDKDLPAGKYALFTIPDEKQWVIIFNKVHNQWGAYNYNENEDALRVTVPAEDREAFTETFTITAEKGKIALTWENFYVAFKVEKG